MGLCAQGDKTGAVYRAELPVQPNPPPTSRFVSTVIFKTGIFLVTDVINFTLSGLSLW